jgi:hypothetical protein
LLDHRLVPLAEGAEVDLVPIAAELAGATAAAFLHLTADPTELADAAREAGATAARAHLPGFRRRRRAEERATIAAARLTALTGAAGLPTMLAVAAITTTVAALPRAAAWAADAALWPYADSHLEALTDELLRVIAPTPLLPRVAAAPGDLRRPVGNSRAEPTQTPHAAAVSGGCPVRAGDRLLLVARHAVDAHRADPDPLDPASPQVAQLIFGAGPHACPGARLARAQLADWLAALAPHRPVVVSARADHHSALPGWRSLIIRSGS